MKTLIVLILNLTMKRMNNQFINPEYRQQRMLEWRQQCRIINIQQANNKLKLFDGELEFIDQCVKMLNADIALSFKQSKWLRKIYNRIM